MTGAPPPPPAVVERSQFQFVREVSGGGSRPLLIVPDGAIYEHAGRGFGDLRLADARGREVPWRPAPEPRDGRLLLRPARSVARVDRAATTVIRLDLGRAGVDVDGVRVTAANRRYDRFVRVLGSRAGNPPAGLGSGRIERYGSNPRTAMVPVSSRARWIEVRIWNGDDPPLHDIRVHALGERNAVLVEGGHPGPLIALYGNRGAWRPDYDFARLPLKPSAMRRAKVADLGTERANLAFVPAPAPPDRRSFLVRHESLVTLALVVAGLAVALAGAVALRRPRSSR